MPIPPARPRRIPPVLGALLAVLAIALVPASAAAIPAAIVSYSASPAPAVDAYAKPGNVIVVTMDLRQRDPARIARWRARGAIVLAYVNAVDHPTRSLGPIEAQLYGGRFPSSWLYPGGASNWPGTRLLDLRAGSPVASYRGFRGRWGDYVANFIQRKVIGDGRLFNGVFLDVWGDRVWNLGIGGRGSSWDKGVTRTTAAIRAKVGNGVYLVANSTPSPATARSLNGRMFESFESRTPGWNNLTGLGENPGLIPLMRWQWASPRLMILWRNEASPRADTKRMLNAAARRASRTGRDIAVGASDHGWGIPAPFAAAR